MMDRRHLKCDRRLEAVTRNVGTMLLQNRDAFGAAPAFAQRESGAWRFWTWDELAEDILRFSSFLRKAHLQKGDAVAVVAKNSYRRLVAEMAVMASGLVSVPLFMGYGDDLMSELIAFSDARMLVADDAARLARLCPSGMPSLVLDDAALAATTYYNETMGGGELAPEERRAIEEDFRRVEPSATMLIMYTSGTASFPKGVMLSHANILSQQSALRTLWNPKPGMRFLCYLPWHHSFGGLFERFFALHSGGCLAVDDSWGKDIDRLLENFSVIRPQIYFSVPKIYQEIVSRALLSDEVKRIFFHGELQFVFTAAAPLPLAISDVFAKHRIPVVEGWGLTETSPCCTLTGMLLGRKPGVVGFPIPGVEVKLGDEDEILVRGPNVMSGYYKLPEKTAEVIDADGWFATGDIGEITPDGVKIVSRKDRIFKLSKGEKVYPAKIEGEVTTVCKLVKHAYVFGSGKDHPCALIFPNFELLRSAVGGGADGSGCARPTSLPALADCLLGCLRKVNEGIALKYERIGVAVIIDRELSLDRGELTPSFKLIPRKVEEHYREYIDAILEGRPERMPKDAYIVDVCSG